METVKQVLEKPLYSNQPKTSMSSLASSNPSDYTMPSLEGWLKGFSDAEFVITDSFHGTIFAIIFNKPFISLINPDRGASRFHSISDELGLSNRLLSDFEERVARELLSTPVDYEGVSHKLADLQEKSEFFLNSAAKVEAIVTANHAHADNTTRRSTPH